MEITYLLVMKLKDFVTLAENSTTKQNFLNVKKTKLKECGINIDDLLNININKKIKKFERRFD